MRAHSVLAAGMSPVVFAAATLALTSVVLLLLQRPWAGKQLGALFSHRFPPSVPRAALLYRLLTDNMNVPVSSQHVCDLAIQTCLQTHVSVRQLISFCTTCVCVRTRSSCIAHVSVLVRARGRP